MTLIPMFTPEYPGAIPFPCHVNNCYNPAGHGGVPNKPRAFILHTPEEPPDNYPGTPHWFQNPAAGGSTIYFVAFTGDVYQCLPETWGAIANGFNPGNPQRLSYPSWAAPYSLNWQTLSVEIEGYAAGIGQSMVIGGPQWNALVALVRDRCEAYGIPLDREHIMGHYQLSVDRTDPGLGFPWAAFIAAVKGEYDMKIAPWWTGRTLTAGKGEIDLYQDFGPGKVYDIRVVLDPSSTGSIIIRHGNQPQVDALVAGGLTRSASGMVVAGGQFATAAPFEVKGTVKVAYLAASGVIA